MTHYAVGQIVQVLEGLSRGAVGRIVEVLSEGSPLTLRIDLGFRRHLIEASKCVVVGPLEDFGPTYSGDELRQRLREIQHESWRNR